MNIASLSSMPSTSAAMSRTVDMPASGTVEESGTRSASIQSNQDPFNAKAHAESDGGLKSFLRPVAKVMSYMPEPLGTLGRLMLKHAGD